jgi:hypothetical protein
MLETAIVTVISGIAIACSLTGSFSMSWGKPWLMPIVATAFCTGSLMWGLYAVILGLKALLIMNVFFFTFESRALYQWCKQQGIKGPVEMFKFVWGNIKGEYKTWRASRVK